MILDYEPGDKVTNPQKKEWGIGQVQSIINGNFIFYNRLNLANTPVFIAWISDFVTWFII